MMSETPGLSSDPVFLSQSHVISQSISANQVSIGMSLSDVVLTFGTTKQVVDPSTGAPGGTTALEWLMSIVLPVPIAVNVLNGLKQVVEEYEKLYGRIPSDPNSKPKVIRAGARETPDNSKASRSKKNKN